METCDDDFVAKAKDFITRQHNADKPFFVWLNTTHMHLFTHTKPASVGQAGRWQSPYHDTMIDHDRNVGEMLNLLDELGIAENTLVMYSSDNGPHMNTWPDGAMTPFRSEKNTNWEGAFRVPMLVRFPGRIQPGTICNGIVQHHDWLATFLAVAGDTDCIERLKKGTTVNGKKFKNHIDGYNLLPFLTGKQKGESSKLLLLLSAMMATSSAFATTTGNWCSWNNGVMERYSLGRTIYTITRAQDIQSEDGSLRAGRRHIEHVLRLALAQHVLPVCGTKRGRCVCGDVQGFPSCTTAGKLYHR
jgi:hypothetical protein